MKCRSLTPNPATKKSRDDIENLQKRGNTSETSRRGRGRNPSRRTVDVRTASDELSEFPRGKARDYSRTVGRFPSQCDQDVAHGKILDEDGNVLYLFSFGFAVRLTPILILRWKESRLVLARSMTMP